MGEKEGGDNKELEETPKDSNTEATAEAKKGGNPVKTLTIGVLVLCLIMFIVYVLSDRHTPYTDQARI